MEMIGSLLEVFVSAISILTALYFYAYEKPRLAFVISWLIKTVKFSIVTGALPLILSLFGIISSSIAVFMSTITIFGLLVFLAVIVQQIRH